MVLQYRTPDLEILLGLNSYRADMNLFISAPGTVVHIYTASHSFDIYYNTKLCIKWEDACLICCITSLIRQINFGIVRLKLVISSLRHPPLPNMQCSIHSPSNAVFFQLKLRTLAGKVMTAVQARRRILVPFTTPSSV